MGQSLLDPPSVEGWHTGRDWINSGSVVKRINFVADRVSNVDLPGIQSIIRRMASNGNAMTPEALVDQCLDLLGPTPASEDTRVSLIEYARMHGSVDLRGHQQGDEAEQRVGEVLRLVASSREFQLA